MRIIAILIVLLFIALIERPPKTGSERLCVVIAAQVPVTSMAVDLQLPDWETPRIFMWDDASKIITMVEGHTYIISVDMAKGDGVSIIYSAKELPSCSST